MMQGIGLQMLAALVALVHIVGLVPALCGVASVLLTVPFAVLLGWLVQLVEEAIKPKSDARIELISEALSGAPPSPTRFLQSHELLY
jgi:hypothetical protein